MSFFMLQLLQLLLLVWKLHGTSCEVDKECSNASTMASSCMAQTCALQSLDLLTIPQDLPHGTTIAIRLCSERSALSGEKLFQDIREVWLRGMDEDGLYSEVECTGEDAGIQFSGVQRVHLQRIKFRGCGVTIGRGDAASCRASVVIARST